VQFWQQIVQLQFTTVQCYMNVLKILCISPLKISPKADRLLACAIPANFHYVNAPIHPTRELLLLLWRSFRGCLAPKPLIMDNIFPKRNQHNDTYYAVIHSHLKIYYLHYPSGMREERLFSPLRYQCLNCLYSQ